MKAGLKSKRRPEYCINTCQELVIRIENDDEYIKN